MKSVENEKQRQQFSQATVFEFTWQRAACNRLIPLKS
jgi:hypothetical protein